MKNIFSILFVLFAFTAKSQIVSLTTTQGINILNNTGSTIKTINLTSTGIASSITGIAGDYDLFYNNGIVIGASNKGIYLFDYNGQYLKRILTPSTATVAISQVKWYTNNNILILNTSTGIYIRNKNGVLLRQVR